MLCVISLWLKAFTICLLEWSICLITCCIMSGKNLWDLCALLCVLYVDYSCSQMFVCAFCRCTWVPWWYLHQPGANGGGCSLACSVCKYLYHLLYLFNIRHSIWNYMKTWSHKAVCSIQASGQSLALPVLFVTMLQRIFQVTSSLVHMNELIL